MVAVEKLKFDYKSLDDLKADLQRFDLDLPIEEDVSILGEPINVGKRDLPNRIAIQPMEGCDALPDGSPGELTFRRYERFARGGAGLIWFEAVAVSELARGIDTQLWINENTVDNFAKLVEATRKAGIENNGVDPYLVIQLTFAGRYGKHKIIAVHEEEIDRRSKVDPNKPVITDEELQALEDDFVAAARLAKQAGFDAVDIKHCHRYLLSELLGAHNRPGMYGGSYENRTRFLKNVINKIKAANIDIDITMRLNSWDGIKYPYGWGCDENGNPDLTEPKRLVKELYDMGMKMINISGSTPYLDPHMSRPYDQPSRFGYTPPEHPLIGVHRLLSLVKEIQQAVPDMVVVGTGYSWLRQFAAQVGAGIVKENWVKVIGFGRAAFAYPDLANDIIKQGQMQRNKVCITCSKCSDLKGNARLTGCVVRDNKVYVPPYLELMKDLDQQEA